MSRPTTLDWQRSEVLSASNRGSRRLTRTRKSVFAAALTLVFVGAVELAVRFVWHDSLAAKRFSQINDIVVMLGTDSADLMFEWDAERFWKLKPNVHIDDPDNPLWRGTVSNSLGFRGPEFALQADPETRRVVCFGDSSTFGIGTTADDAWPAQLESLINANGPVAVEVINAGVPGYTSWQGLQHMRQELDRLNPDVVLASYANNDFWRWDDRTDREQAEILAGRRPGPLKWLQRSMMIRVLSDAITRARQKPDTNWARQATRNYFEPNQQWVPRVPLEQFRENIQEMVRLCDSRGIRLMVVLWPDQPQAAGKWSLRIDYQSVLKQIASEHDLGIVDVVSEFQRNQPWSVHTYIPNDIVHVNAAGNRLAATAAFRAIQLDPLFVSTALR